jgi:hypothetical protein
MSVFVSYTVLFSHDYLFYGILIESFVFHCEYRQTVLFLRGGVWCIQVWIFVYKLHHLHTVYAEYELIF